MLSSLFPLLFLYQTADTHKDNVAETGIYGKQNKNRILKRWNSNRITVLHYVKKRIKERENYSMNDEGSGSSDRSENIRRVRSVMMVFTCQLLCQVWCEVWQHLPGHVLSLCLCVCSEWRREILRLVTRPQTPGPRPRGPHLVLQRLEQTRGHSAIHHKKSGLIIRVWQIMDIIPFSNSA